MQDWCCQFVVVGLNPMTLTTILPWSELHRELQSIRSPARAIGKRLLLTFLLTLLQAAPPKANRQQYTAASDSAEIFVWQE